MNVLIVWASIVSGLPLILALLQQGWIALLREQTPAESTVWPACDLVADSRRTRSDQSMSADLREVPKAEGSVGLIAVRTAARCLGSITVVVGMIPAAVAGPAEPVDRAGDPLPPGAVARLGTTRFRRGSSIRQVAYTPDGGTLATLGDDGVIRLWDAATGVEIRHLAAAPPASGFALASPGRTLFTASREDRLIRGWDVASGRQVRCTADHGVATEVIASSPDGRRLACGGRDGIALVDPTTGRLVRRIEGHPHGNDFLIFTPDGRLLISAGRDAVRWTGGRMAVESSIRSWDVDTGEPRRRIPTGTDEVVAVAVSPDGRRLAAGLKDRSVRIWGAGSGTELHRFAGLERDAACLAFSPDGRTLASGEGAPEPWDTRDVGLGGISLLDVASGRELRRWEAHQPCVRGLAFSPDGRTLASGGEEGLVRLWDPATGREVQPAPGHRGAIRAIAFAPDGRTVATAGFDGTLRVWDPACGVELRRAEAGRSPTRFLAFSADGALLASGARDSLRLWEPDTLRELRRFGSMARSADGAALSPDGRILASMADGGIRLWETATGDPRAILGGAEDEFARDPVFLGDGATVAAMDRGTSLRLWDASTGRELHSITTREMALLIEPSPDGRIVAVAEAAVQTQDRQVSLWEVATGQEVGRLGGHLGLIRAIAFSPDGRLLVTGADDRPRWRDQSLRVWDVASGRLLRRLDAHRSGVDALAFSPDGARLASAGEDGSALIWDVRALIPGALPSPSVGSPEPLEALWGALRGDDAAAAESAAWALAGRPGPATALLAGSLRPATPIHPSWIASLIADLDSPRFAARERASAELGRLGRKAEPALKDALGGRPTAEVRLRIGRLLSETSQSIPSPELLQARRAIGVLERIGTDEARRVLEELAGGAPGMPETEQARAAARRLRSRSGALPKSPRQSGVVGLARVVRAPGRQDREDEHHQGHRRTEPWTLGHR
jgi:WD40 repeat protein